MIDIHAHILPAMDDGAKDVQTAMAMLAMAQENGTRVIVATPHVTNGVGYLAWEDIVKQCEELQQAAVKKGLALSILPGAEVAMSVEILDQLHGPGPYCINGSRYVLVELPRWEIPNYADEFFFVLQARGFVPIIAHPERHQQIIRNQDVLKQWLIKGMRVQMNVSSILGRMGDKVKKTAEWLFINNMVHVLGSDAHGVDKRRPVLLPAIKQITATGGYERMQQLAKNSEHIINNEDLEVFP